MKKQENKYSEIKDLIKSNKTLKTVVMVGIAIATLYLLSKLFTILASTVRGYNDLRLAMNGQ